MTDEKYTFIQDVRDKKITARSARSTRTHNGKRGAVKLPCDYMTKKEISAMSGEVKSYRLNEPMIWKEFMAMPDDIKTTYIKLLRQKYNVPALRISAMLSISPKYLTNELQRLGLADGHTRSGRTKWDKEGWTAFLNGVPRQVAAEPDVTIPEETSDAVAEAVTEAFAEIQEGSHTSRLCRH